MFASFISITLDILVASSKFAEQIVYNEEIQVNSCALQKMVNLLDFTN